MKTDIIRFLELPAEQYENSKKKNAFIGECSAEYIGVVNSDVTSAAEVVSLLEELDFGDAQTVLFAENVPGGIMDLTTALSCFAMKIFAFVFPKRVLCETGCFNEKLADGTNYEFLCRLAEQGNIRCVACADEASGRLPVLPDKVYCHAYVIRRYMTRLKKENVLDAVFGNLSIYMEQAGAGEAFRSELDRMLSDDSHFVKTESDTAPFLVISGDDMCHGVLKDFASGLAQALVDKGQAVTTTDGMFGSYTGAAFAAQRTLKGIVGFQAPVLEKTFFQKIDAPKIQFWFDNPIFFDDLLHDLPDNYYILCQDALYAKFIREYYNTRHAVAFPPAGKAVFLTGNEQRRFDVSFVGTYRQPDMHCALDAFQQEFWEYMLKNPSRTFEMGLSGLLFERQIDVSREEYLAILKSLANVCRNVNYYFRHKTVESILGAGITLHVFGDTWEAYEGAGREHMVIHPFVTVEESLQVLADSKIGLNIMTWHKAGMTERVANIMISGAVCVSDETIALREYFKEDEEIVLFCLERLDELPDKIKKLLADYEYRSGIAQRGRQKASAEHVWRKRADELLQLLQSEETE